MVNKKVAPRWFLITHEECRSSFTVNPKGYIEGHKNKKIPELRCPCCHEHFPQQIREKLEEFFKTYLALIDELSGYCLTIEEITNQDKQPNL